MGVDEHRREAPKSVDFAVITVSDTRTEEDDLSGKTIVEMMESSGHRCLRKAIVKDDVHAIQQVMREMLSDPSVRAVIINGGTGVSKRDVTFEALEDYQEKELPGFGELFRALSYQEIGGAAMLSRATAFVSEGRPVFCLPGSRKAVALAVGKLIAPELGHLVWEVGR